MILNISICLFEQTNASVKTEDLKTVNESENYLIYKSQI